MGKVVPFGGKHSSDELKLREHLKTNPNSLKTWASVLKLAVSENKFNAKADYAEKILNLLQKANADDICAFIDSVAPIGEAVGWWRYAHLSDDPVIQEPVQESGIAQSLQELRNNPCHIALTELTLKQPLILEARDGIYKKLFSDDTFLEDVRNLFPIESGAVNSFLDLRSSLMGENVNLEELVKNPALKEFLSECIRRIISAHGLTESLICMFLFSDYPCKKLLTNKAIWQLLRKYGVTPPNDESSRDYWHSFESIAEDYLSAEFNDNKLEFVDLYRLLILRYRLSKNCDDICNAVIDNIPKTELPDILRGMASDSDFSSDNPPQLSYKSSYSTEQEDFQRDFYSALSESNKLSYDIAFDAFLYFNLYLNLSECPLNLLVLGSIYQMDEIPGSGPSYTISGFFIAGKSYLKKSLYKEAMVCFKTALFNMFFPFGEDLTEKIDISDVMSTFVSTVKKMNEYENGVDFLLKLSLMSKHGYETHQGVLNEIEIAKDELEHEFDVRSHHARNQQKVEELSEKFSRLEQKVIDTKEEVLNSIHERNKVGSARMNRTSVESYYQSELGQSLWGSLNPKTKEHLLIGKYLDEQSSYFETTEFGYIAVEYALAVENEFKTKIIDIYLQQAGIIQYAKKGKIETISKDTNITLGQICHLVDQARVASKNGHMLRGFHDFIINHTAGKKEVFPMKSPLFRITGYRNTAAHVSRFSRDNLDELRQLFFSDGFLKNYMTSIQTS